MRDKRFLLEFIKNLSERDYSKAEGALQMAVNEKIKSRIKKSLKTKGTNAGCLNS